MGEGNVSAALELLDNASSSGLLPLNEEVMSELQEKHPDPAPVTGDPLLRGPLKILPSYCFN